MDSIRIGCIYLITNMLNGMKYVGKTMSPTPHRRWRGHKSDARLHKYENCYLSNAINKYGENNFTIITLCVVPLSSLSNMEAYFAEQYGTYVWDTPGGYNMIECGGGGHIGVPRTESTKAKLSVSVKKSFTQEMRNASSERGRTQMTQAHQQKMLDAVKNMSEADKKKAQEKRTAALNTAEAKKNNSEKIKALYKDPVYREKQAKLRREQWTPERREKQRQSALAAHARKSAEKVPV